MPLIHPLPGQGIFHTNTIPQESVFNNIDFDFRDGVDPMHQRCPLPMPKPLPPVRPVFVPTYLTCATLYRCAPTRRACSRSSPQFDFRAQQVTGLLAVKGSSTSPACVSRGRSYVSCRFRRQEDALPQTDCLRKEAEVDFP